MAEDWECSEDETFQPGIRSVIFEKDSAQAGDTVVQAGRTGGGCW